MDEREILQQLDMLRPHSDDLRELGSHQLQDRLASDAHAQALHERLQAMDASILTAFHDVAPPDGLEERLLSRLSTVASPGQAVSPGQAEEQADERPAGDSRHVAVPAEDADRVDPSQRQLPQRQSLRRRMSPRRWVAMVTAAAVAAGILTVAFLPWQSGDAVTSWEELVTESMHFHRNENADPGRRLAQHPAPARYPISAHVIRGPRTAWRGVDDFNGRPAIAYDLQASGARATLYVIRDRMQQLPNSPNLQQSFGTGGLWAIAWQEPEATYVLVARETRQHLDPLRLFLRSPSPIL